MILLSQCLGVFQSSMFLYCYCPILLTCQMHTDYTVSAHNILIFDPFLVVFVKCTDNNHQLDVFIVLSVAYSRYKL